jgi:cytochrome bd-type quinol oxidase subunit 2
MTLASHLLQPTLSRDSIVSKPYSVGALIAAAFFGGAFAVLVLGGENSRRQRRLTRDLPWLLLGLAAWLGIALLPFLDSFSSTIADHRAMARLVNRGAGFVLAGVFYCLHRRNYRTMATMGLAPPKPYGPVAAAVISGIFMTNLLYRAVDAMELAGNE